MSSLNAKLLVRNADILSCASLFNTVIKISAQAGCAERIIVSLHAFWATTTSASQWNTLAKSTKSSPNCHRSTLYSLSLSLPFSSY